MWNGHCRKRRCSTTRGETSILNLISAFHKSLRGSDPDAALYWLARMLEAGEDALYVARRMVRFASEDVGNADPFAMRLALGAMESFRFLGHPEGDLALAQAAVYLATAPKSNSVYQAWNTGETDGPGERRAAGSPAHQKCAHGLDEGPGLRQGLPVCPRF